MVRRHTVIGLVLAVAVAGGGWGYAQQRNAPATLTLQDYMEIQQLYAAYARAVDLDSNGDGNSYAVLYTPDGEWSTGPGMIKGSAALAKMITRRYGQLKAQGWESRHANTNLLLTPTPEGARGSVYALVYDASTHPATINHSGVYDDLLVKTANGWRFKRRIFRRDGPQPVATSR